jgi:hypothetical protein
MKKLVLLLAASIIAVAAYASTTIIINPDEMKNGETKSFTDDGTTVIVKRSGDAMDIKIEGAGQSRTITVTRAGDGDITINRNGRRFHVVTPDVVVPPIHIPNFREHRVGTLFVCPKDGTTLRVPEDKKDESFKCPVDGTAMEKKKGRGFVFSFDDKTFDEFDWL